MLATKKKSASGDCDSSTHPQQQRQHPPAVLAPLLVNDGVDELSGREAVVGHALAVADQPDEQVRQGVLRLKQYQETR